MIWPPGAHRLDNTGDRPLRYLCISTMLTTEICGYPDSGKFACYSAASTAAVAAAAFVPIAVFGPLGGALADAKSRNDFAQRATVMLAERFQADSGRIARIVLETTTLSFITFSAAVAWLK